MMVKEKEGKRQPPKKHTRKGQGAATLKFGAKSARTSCSWLQTFLKHPKSEKRAKTQFHVFLSKDAPLKARWCPATFNF
jgi:hypothetical protein